MTSSALAKYHVGQVVGAVSARLEAKVTKPPPRYTQDTLLDDMLAAYKFAKAPAHREALKEIGLGTSRTRISVLTALIKRGLLISEKRGKGHEIRTSDFARALLALMPPNLTDVATTAMWEIAFKAIEDGRVTKEQVIERNFKDVCSMVEAARAQKGSYVPPAAGFAVHASSSGGGGGKSFSQPRSTGSVGNNKAQGQARAPYGPSAGRKS